MRSRNYPASPGGGPHSAHDSPIGPTPRTGPGYRRRVISWPHRTVGISLAASSLLGAGVRYGHVVLGRRRWLHHALYAATLTSSAGAAAVDAARARPTWPVAACTLGVLAALPATGGGSTAHLWVAAVATATYVVGTVVVTR